MSQPEKIISGPEIDFKIYEGSWPQYLLKNLKALPQDHILQVDGETGEQQSVQKFLKASIAVAEGLKQLKLRVGIDIVPVIGDFSWNSIAAATGGLLSGVPIYPMDPDFKAFEIKQLLEPFQPHVIFCEKKCAQYVLEALDLLEIVSAKIFLLDGGNSENPRFHNFNDILKDNSIDTYTPPVIASPADTVAMIAASSGTTGLPKGVMITHRNLIYRMHHYEHMLFAKNRSPYIATTHFYWISGILVTMGSCLTGFTNIFLKNATPSTLLKAIEKYKAEWTFFLPVQIAQLLSHPDLKKYDLSSLKFARIGGSMMPKTIADRVKNEWPTQTFFAQVYGMTELMGGITAVSKTNLHSVGLLGKGIQLKVVDLSTGKTLGPNEIGELRFKSFYGTMKGYLGNEEATLQAFDDSGFYCSGDMGYYTEDNHLFVVDRIKEYIQWRTYHISPSEIESAILNLPGVEDVGVVGVPHEEDAYRATALVVKKSGYQTAEQDIIDYVSEKLSSQKHLYGGVKFVDAIPRTSNGKIRRHLLTELI